MIMRQGPTAANPIEELRALLDDDDETGAIAKMGQLEQKLRWMFAERTDWSLVRPLLADTNIPSDQKTALYPHNDLRSEFTALRDIEAPSRSR